MKDIKRFEPIWQNWVIEQKIGEGSFGSVWRAYREDQYTDMRQFAAIKHIMIPKEASIDDLDKVSTTSLQKLYRSQLNELLGEIKTMVELRGKPYIVSYEEHKIVERENGGFDVFVRMELLASIGDYIAQHGMLNVGDVVRMGIQIASALEVLQSRRLIHRDIKPGNILVDKDGDFKLSDFGTARVLDGGAAASTHTGTPIYMAPEVYLYSRHYDQTVDIYSMGLVLYRFLNEGYLPFCSSSIVNSREAMLRRIGGEAPPPPSGGDDALKAIVMKCIAFKPEDRWQTAAELREQLEHYQTMIQLRNGSTISSEHQALDRQETMVSSERPDLVGTIRTDSTSATADTRLTSVGTPVEERTAKQSPTAGKKNTKPWVYIAALVVIAAVGAVIMVMSGGNKDEASHASSVLPVTAVPTAMVTDALPTVSPAPTAVPIPEQTAYPAGIVNDLQYEQLEDGTVRITNYKGSAESIVLPTRINGKVVTQIGDRAFYYKALTSVSIPYGVTFVGDEAFAGNYMTSVTMPDSIVAIGCNPFRHCEQLSSVAVSLDHPGLATIDGVLFSKSDQRLVWYPLTAAEAAYTIPQGIRTIGDYAFSGCTKLKSVTMPDSVVSIGNRAFFRCTYLKDLTMSNSVASIGDYAFTYCTWLTSVTIPGNATSIGNSAFSGCSNLKNLTIEDGVAAIGDQAFSICNTLTSVSLPNSIAFIGENPFAYCAKLTSVIVSSDHPVLAVIDDVLFSKSDQRLVWYPRASDAVSYTIPQGTRMIGDYAFARCESLVNVTVPDGIVSIGDRAFYECENLTSLTMPDSVTAIGDYAFFSCNALTNIVIPANVDSIGDDAFRSCQGLISVTISDGVASIGDQAFASCTNLRSVTIPDSVITIGVNPFSFCKNLTSVEVSPDHPTLAVVDGVLFSQPDQRLVWYPSSSATVSYSIPQGICSIDDYAFYCTNVESVMIPDTVTSIGRSAFAVCTRLTNITIPDGVTSIWEDAFYDCTKLVSVTIPGSVTSIGKGAFSGCKSLTNIVIPDGVITIGDDAFHNCTSLTSVTIPASVTKIGKGAFNFYNDGSSAPLNIAFIVDRNSFAERYCIDNGFSYRYPDSLDWLNY